MSELNIGGLFTPSGIKDAADRLQSSVKAISKEVFGANDVPTDFEDSWDAFSQEFVNWKSDNLGFFSTVLNSTRDSLADFVGRYNVLRARWVSIYPQTAGEDFSVTSDTVAGALEGAGSAIGKTLTSVSIGVVAIGVALVLVWVFFKRSK